MIIASGNSDRHVRSIADSVVQQAKSGGLAAHGRRRRARRRMGAGGSAGRDGARDAAAGARVLRARAAVGDAGGGPQGSQAGRKAPAARAAPQRAARRRRKQARRRAPASRSGASALKAAADAHAPARRSPWARACRPGSTRPSRTTRAGCARRLPLELMELPAAKRSSRDAAAKAMAEEAARSLAALAPRRLRRGAGRARHGEYTTLELAQWLGERRQDGQRPVLSSSAAPTASRPRCWQRAQQRWSLSRADPAACAWCAWCWPSSCIARRRCWPATPTIASEPDLTEVCRRDPTAAAPQLSRLGSPRRRELLARSACRTWCRPPTSMSRSSPARRRQPALRGSRVAKARAVHGAAPGRPQLPVLGADTLVVLDGVMLGKPRDARRCASHAARSCPAARTACSPRWRWLRPRASRRGCRDSEVRFRAPRRRRSAPPTGTAASRATRPAATRSRAGRGVRRHTRRQLLRRHGPAAVRDGAAARRGRRALLAGRCAA